MEKPRTEPAPGDSIEPGPAGLGENICPKCDGSGQIDGQECAYCSGRGHIVEGIAGA